MTEKKPLGFEIQDIRIGGLIQRVKHSKRVLEKYLDGQLEVVEELEQELLAPFGMTHGKIGYNCYAFLPTTGVL